MLFSNTEKPEETDEDLSDSARALKNESAATYGSLAFNYGVHNDLLQSQFSLHTKNQKKFQIALLKVSCLFLENSDNSHILLGHITDKSGYPTLFETFFSRFGK